MGSNPGQRAKTPLASGPKINCKTEFFVTFFVQFCYILLIFLLQDCKKFNKLFKNGPHQS